MNNAPSPQFLNRSILGDSAPGPLHGQVRQFLRDAIEEHFEDGQSFWTERLLIERLGIARGTLRQALDELAREGVLVREAKRGSFVRKVAASTLALVFERANSDFCSEMIQHIAAQCLARDLKLELYPLFAGTSIEHLTADLRGGLNQKRLLLMCEGGDFQLSSSLREGGFRFLSLDEMAGQDVPFVTTESDLAVRLAMEHLLALGHRRITFLVNEPAGRPSVGRKIAAFERLRREHNLDESCVVDCQTRSGQSSFQNALDAMPRVWNDEARPTAIFTASDPGAWAALRWFAQRGIQVPDEVSVLGFEGVKPDAFTHPPLSTVAHDLDELAKRALDALWSDDSQLASQWVAPRLLLRQSTAPPR